MTAERFPISLLDRSRTRAGEDPAHALAASVTRAQQADSLGFHRFWVAEHHSVPGIASGHAPVLMAAIAAATRSIRVGSGGVMLPNHRPLQVAEQALMLEALFPGRIDLGLGRSLGFTRPVRTALGVEKYSPDDFTRDLTAVHAFLEGTGPVTAMPPLAAPPPVHVLATGSGLAVAARLGLPVVVGGPVLFGELGALEEYRRSYRPSPAWPEPRVTISLEVMIANSPERARELLLPEAVALAESRTTGSFGPLREVTTAEADALPERVRTAVGRQLDLAVHGTPARVRTELGDLVRRTGAAEVLASTSTFDHDALAAADAALADLQT
ncbi:MsnO8 family LLM class oxidoreductase [Occultella glacieicola]|uniref:MsnO8 family LLM class oxidoreductase n=1 Tax=Occultella glacieicola TaxID=2518684 RepID=A0ABY2E8R2_9MICO|nr:MsnO8 family LLM class oxidoreductase [Occultella glacieicola]TDE97373.1 MsnO8 family LLM class oxidoreductase [Occultella glacieicola]